MSTENTAETETEVVATEAETTETETTATEEPVSIFDAKPGQMYFVTRWDTAGNCPTETLAEIYREVAYAKQNDMLKTGDGIDADGKAIAPWQVIANRSMLPLATAKSKMQTLRDALKEIAEKQAAAHAEGGPEPTWTEEIIEQKLPALRSKPVTQTETADAVAMLAAL